MCFCSPNAPHEPLQCDFNRIGAPHITRPGKLPQEAIWSHGNRNSRFSHENSMVVIFHCYVSSPEGIGSVHKITFHRRNVIFRGRILSLRWPPALMSGFFFRAQEPPTTFVRTPLRPWSTWWLNGEKTLACLKKQTIGLFHGLNLFLVVHVIGDIMRMRIMELIYIYIRLYKI